MMNKYWSQKHFDFAAKRFKLAALGYHGILHWTSVHDTGIILAEETGADVPVVKLFALFHDLARETEGADPNHGYRSCDIVDSLGPDYLELDTEQYHLLRMAIQGHNKGETISDETIGTCWDADRLDMWRVGQRPDEHYLSTDIAKRFMQESS